MMNYEKFEMWSASPTTLSVGYDDTALFYLGSAGVHRCSAHHPIATDEDHLPRFIKGMPPNVKATIQKWGIGAPQVQAGEVVSAMTVGKHDFALIYCPATDSLRLVYRTVNYSTLSLLLIRAEGIYRYLYIPGWFKFAPTDGEGRLEILR